MSDLAIKRSTQVNNPRALLPRPASGVIAALFFGYLAVGLPLPVIPLFIHGHLGFSNLIVGLVIGFQFLATVLTRGYAGRVTDQQGGKRSALQGALLSALAGGLYLVAAATDLSPTASLGIVIAGRLIAGVGESQFVTGCVSWSIASVGPQRAGMSMSWTGIAMFAALSIGAPVGMALYEHYSLAVAMMACTAAPLHRCTGAGCVDRARLCCLCVARRCATTILSGGRAHLARRAGADAARGRLIRTHRLCLPLLCGTSLAKRRSGHDCLWARVYFRSPYLRPSA